MSRVQESRLGWKEKLENSWHIDGLKVKTLDDIMEGISGDREKEPDCALGRSTPRGVLKRQIPILTYQGRSAEAAQAFLCRDGNPKSPRFDHLVAIERAGRAADGNYYNTRKRNIKHVVDPIDDLFLAVQKIPGISSPGVSDGGNELGIGKVKEAVKRHIRNGDIIACDVETDFAVIAGVSNWGGYALACALYILNSCEVHRRYPRKAIGPFRAPGEQNWTQALPSITKGKQKERRPASPLNASSILLPVLDPEQRDGPLETRLFLPQASVPTALVTPISGSNPLPSGCSSQSWDPPTPGRSWKKNVGHPGAAWSPERSLGHPRHGGGGLPFHGTHAQTIQKLVDITMAQG
ncbi:hypothetical protein J1605_020003 [Eschrichtius robustus]|uniref:D-glutamate cyclase-like C-terminal domain-containing protein n=1 Tax=Eschrichtius robustus TaxID=9764 RepID=A0AB34HH17_ESCRO|nr:hypothetical protein J1605_020003 [Eschrichtius robustus]